MRVALLGLGLLMACSSSAVGTGGSSSSGASKSGFDSNDPTESGGTSTMPPSTTNGNSDIAPTGSSAFDPLFDAPSSASTTDTVKGLWAGSFGYDNADVRVKLEANQITAAIRCDGRSTVGAVVTAKVSDSQIRVLESKDAGGTYSCGVHFRPVTITKCATANDLGCYTVKDGTLYFSGVALFQDGEASPDPSFTKLSD